MKLRLQGPRVVLRDLEPEDLDRLWYWKYEAEHRQRSFKSLYHCGKAVSELIILPQMNGKHCEKVVTEGGFY
ncbi:hypothetical protein JOD24_003241 [Kroppenstedtia sanguinis]|uniref:hypothetical protein n=1 Tax=Kroppenstedtia sanguinis TaxID=1380684 RepID=UPI003D23C974